LSVLQNKAVARTIAIDRIYTVLSISLLYLNLVSCNWRTTIVLRCLPANHN